MSVKFCAANQEAIRDFGTAGGQIDAAIQSASHKDASYNDLVNLMGRLTVAADALRKLNGAREVEKRNGAHHAAAKASRDRHDREHSKIVQHAAARTAHADQELQAKLTSNASSGTHAVRRLLDFALPANGSVGIKGLVFAYLVGLIICWSVGATGDGLYFLAGGFPLAAIAIALLCENRLRRRAAQYRSEAEEQKQLIENECQRALQALQAMLSGELRQAERELAERLAKLAAIFAQADTALANRAVIAHQLFDGWSKASRKTRNAISATQGESKPPRHLELGSLSPSVLAD